MDTFCRITLVARTHLQWVGAGEKNAMKFLIMKTLFNPNKRNLSMMQTVLMKKPKEILRNDMPDIKVFQNIAGNEMFLWCRSCN